MIFKKADRALDLRSDRPNDFGSGFTTKESKKSARYSWTLERRDYSHPNNFDQVQKYYCRNPAKEKLISLLLDQKKKNLPGHGAESLSKALESSRPIAPLSDQRGHARSRQESHHNNQQVWVLLPWKIPWRRHMCLSFQGHHKAAPGSHHALPLDEPSTTTKVVSKYHLAF